MRTLSGFLEARNSNWREVDAHAYTPRLLQLSINLHALAVHTVGFWEVGVWVDDREGPVGGWTRSPVFVSRNVGRCEWVGKWGAWESACYSDHAE